MFVLKMGKTADLSPEESARLRTLVNCLEKVELIRLRNPNVLNKECVILNSLQLLRCAKEYVVSFYQALGRPQQALYSGVRGICSAPHAGDANEACRSSSQ
jgi:hypothetical protein